MVKLPIPNYTGESYYYKTISCLYAPLAIISGYYSYKNYFYFCGYYSLYTIWKDTSDFVLKSNRILNKFGLILRAQKITERETFFDTVEESLNNKVPMFVFFDYYNMFYCDFNYKLRHGPHGIIVNGIDKERETITIMDCAHIGFDNPFQALTLTQDIFWDIWERSNSYFSRYPVNVYFIERDETNLTSCDDYAFFEDLLKGDIVSENDSLITKTICNNNIKTYDSDLYRRDYVDSLKPVFDILTNIFKEEKDLLLNFKDLEQNYLRNRSKIFSAVLKTAYKGLKLSKEQQDKYVFDAKEMNNELFSFLGEFYRLKKQSSSVFDKSINQHLRDYAPEAKLEASSELEAYSTVFSADRAINGKYNAFESDMWASQDINEPHWLSVDLGRQVEISRINVIHDYRSPDLFLIDYAIQGSNNNIDWETIENISGNIKSRTEHNCHGVSFRYYRVYITKSSKIDNIARIFGIECWGC